MNDDVPQNKIVELKDLLKTLDEKNWTVEPRPTVKDSLEETDKSGHGTKEGATGSPPKGTFAPSPHLKSIES